MPLKEVSEQFFCNLKQDTFHAIGDQITFWSVRGFYSLSDIQVSFGSLESFMFYHGWLILLLWRILNAALDSYKRIRDVSKPEWKTQIKPLLVAEERRNRNLSVWQKFKSFFRSLW